MEQKLKVEHIPYNYALCFNKDCQQCETCLHFQAGLLKPDTVLRGNAVYPSAWKDGKCKCYNEKKLVRRAWGFSKLYRNVSRYHRAEARNSVKNYFSRGNGPYYRYHHGENKLSPEQQDDILRIIARFGSLEGIAFDHYETGFDFR